MLWSVVALKVEDLRDSENAVKLSHCNSALRILHLCSIDKNSLTDLLHSKLLEVLLCLLTSLNRAIHVNTSKNVFNFSRQDSMNQAGGASLDLEQKQESSFKEEESHADEKKEKRDMEEDSLNCSGDFRGSTQFDTVTASNDNIFYEADEQMEGGAHNKTVHFDFADQEQEQGHSSSKRPLGRRRTDSYIVRADTRNRQRSESRSNIPLLEQSISQSEVSDGEEPTSPTATPTLTPSRGASSVKPDTRNQQQLRRISRSMSISMQLSKTNNEEEDDKDTLPNTDDILKHLTKHVVMIIYHVLNRSYEKTWFKVLSMHFIPLLVNTVSLFEENFKEEIGLPISVSLINCQRFLQDSSQGML